MKNYFVIAAIALLPAGCKLNNNEKEKTDNNQNKTMNTNNAETLYNRVSWRHNANIYEVNVRQYTPEGTFKAFMSEMPRLRDMGIEVLWFMPVTPIAQKGKKGTMGSPYACSDYTSVNPEFGSLQDFKDLVAEAHKQGFKVIIDWVANHTGWDHVWTKTHPAYYQKDSATNDFKIASGMDDIIELDYKNPELRKAMIDAMKFWVTECDIDGYRADLAFWVELDFWKEARTELEKTKQLYWLAENDPLDNRDYMQVFDATYTWTWMHKTKDFYQSHLPIASLDSVLQRYDTVPPKGSIMAWFTTNHDENSWNGTEYEKYGDMAKALAVFSCTWNGTPLIYSGQEMPNKKRLAFFEKDPIKWTDKNELHDFYKTLLKLKSTHPALRAGDDAVKSYRLQTDANDKIFSFVRKNGDREVLVVLNFSKEKLRFELTDKQVTGKYKNIFGGAENDFTTDKFFEMQPWEYLVYEK
jgi:alpha-amylase